MEKTPSGREMADVAIENGAVDMAQGVVHTPPPQIFIDTLNRLYEERAMHVYSSPAGYLPYREALLGQARKENASLDLESVIATNGVTGGLVSALREHCKVGEKVMLLEPFYPAHDWAIKVLNLETAYVPYADDLTLDMDAIESSLPDVKAFVLGNPANPTGTVVSGDDLIRIYEMCRKNGVLLIVDEVYKNFVWEGSYVSLLEKEVEMDHLVVLRSWSKNLALAGWRIGYAIASEDRAHRMIHNIHEALYVGAPAVPQVIMAELMKSHWPELEDFIAKVLDLYKENRNVISESFRSYGMNPLPKEGAYYMMIEHKRANDIDAMQELLDEGIAVAPGMPFYRPGTKNTGKLRAHFALSEENRDKVQEILAK